MSDTTQGNELAAQGPRPAGPRSKRGSDTPAKVLLISYPKIVFLYPTFLVAVAAAVYLTLNHQPLEPGNAVAAGLSVVFLGVLAANFVVLGFDFPRTSSLTLFFMVVAIATGCALVFVLNPGLLPVVTNTLRQFRPLANATFYWAFASILGLIMLAAVISARFDRWEARPNELLHREGIWGNLRRFPVLGLRIEKEMSDVFEYVLLRSGRLILRPSNEPRAIILDNVPFIRKKEETLTRLLGALEVEIRTESEETD